MSNEDKRKAALERQAKYDGLTTQQKIIKACDAPGNSQRQLVRLQKQLTKEMKNVC